MNKLFYLIFFILCKNLLCVDIELKKAIEELDIAKTKLLLEKVNKFNKVDVLELEFLKQQLSKKENILQNDTNNYIKIGCGIGITYLGARFLWNLYYQLNKQEAQNTTFNITMDDLAKFLSVGFIVQQSPPSTPPGGASQKKIAPINVPITLISSVCFLGGSKLIYHGVKSIVNKCKAKTIYNLISEYNAFIAKEA